ncbi:DinB family protein [Chitinibacter tainanensis]|uniref:DinB family protein n=1 Tax=Chitinibacter tainanensis TaxID=230667 RepID=UPI0023521C1D|nr:DinB family protein [Chitinibacter tainanensis]
MSTHFMHAAFAHKSAATQELLAQLQQHGEQLPPKNLHLATRLLNHLAVIDQIFLAHLRGEEHGFTATNTPATPTLAELIALQTQLDQAWLALLAQPACQDLSRVIEFVFTDGKPARMTVGDILLHVLTHASYHRGQIGRIISEGGKSPVKITPDILTGYLHRTT